MVSFWTEGRERGRDLKTQNGIPTLDEIMGNISLPLYALPRREKILKTYLQTWVYKTRVISPAVPRKMQSRAETKTLLVVVLQSNGRVRIKNLLPFLFC